jgi:sugar lactone lactonase YvrE
VANWLDYPAVADFALGMPNGALAVPIGLDVAPDGRVYVAEDQGYRISIFDQDGAFLQSVGQRGAASQEGVFFERPHSIRMAPDGTLYVVDTWNYQIRRFTADWQPLGRWGSPITVGIDAPTEPTDGLWGPRDLAIDPDGNVYVADTGNKRVRVYDPNGVWLRDIGKGGSGDGQLDEPTGLAVHAGRLYVADTWNRRIAVFGLDGIWQTNIPVRAWYGEPFSRPYLTIDPERSLLYVADPEGGRILVYDLNGECVGAFGRLNTEFPALNEFAAIGGIDVDGAGNVYVVDLTRGRLLKFPPFPLTSVEPVGLGDAIGVPLDLGDEGDPALPAVTPEVSAEVEE